MPAPTVFTLATSGIHTVVLEKSGAYQVVLKEPAAEAQIIGIFQTQADEVVKIQLEVIHAVAHTRAQTVLKGVARDKSLISFQGKIIIHEHCGDTQSFLEERILLLSDQAKAEAIPELEILANDVKCSHAASVSPIPAEHIHYLQARGLSQRQAEDLVIDGFLELNDR